MNVSDSATWFDEIATKRTRVRRDEDGYYREDDAAGWLAEAEAAIRSVFPAGHPICARWNSALTEAQARRTFIPHGQALDPATGIFLAAKAIVNSDRIGSIVEGIQAETISDVLDQAEALLPERPIPATVLAGGALETHLRHLCTRNNLSWPGAGSISKYDAAIAQARKAGTVEVYRGTDSHLIEGWAALRNLAAHEPTKFSYGADEIRRMIAAVREFLARVP